jgi:hypothetical protein
MNLSGGALTAWKLAASGRRSEHTENGGLFTCKLIGQGATMVGTSRIDDADATAQALTIANTRTYEEKFGTDQWREWSRILVELQRMAG